MPDANKKFIVCAAAAIIDADNRVLIQERPAHKRLAGFWEFPGGKLEVGETPEAALVRELLEELGIETLEKALFPLSFISYNDDEEIVLIPVYGVRNWVGTPQAMEGQKLAWVRSVRLADYKLLESNRPLIAPLSVLI